METDPAARWKPWSAPAALIIGIAAALVGQAVILALAAAGGQSSSDLTPAESIVFTFVQDLCFVGAAIWLASRVARTRPGQFGLRRTSIALAIGLIVGGQILFDLVSTLWARALNLHQADKILDKLGADRSTVALVGAAVLTCVVAPICEEFLFRGYMFRALRNWRGPWVAAALVGLLFGAVHLGSAPAGDLVPLAAFGGILCVIYELTGSLLPCIALHCLNNSVAFGALENASAGTEVWLTVGALVSIGVVVSAVVRSWPGTDRPAAVL
jgi:membrane protease YdiL (CAAX protease family)